MGATWTKRDRSFRIAVHHNGQRAYVTVRSEQDAKALVREIHRRELAGENVLQAIRTARAATPNAPSQFPTLKVAVLGYIDAQVRAGDMRESTALNYRNRVTKWLFPTLGDVAVNEVAREQIGGVIRTIREAGRSSAIRRGVINPLRGMYMHMIENKILPGPNPCADLKWFVGRKREAQTSGNVPFFTVEEMPKVLDAFKALQPRWHPFVMSAFFAGLRYSELAALYRDDLDVQRGLLTVERGMSGGKVAPTKTSKVRHVKVSPALLKVLRDHMEAMALDAQAGQWSAESRRWMFPTKQGNPLRYNHFQEKIWTPTLKAAKVVHRRFHATGIRARLIS
jgi:integrase